MKKTPERYAKDSRTVEERLKLDGKLSELKNKLLKDEVFLKICAIVKRIDAANSENLGLLLKQLYIGAPNPLTEEEAESLIQVMLKDKEV
jgi:hypothetical protein